VGQGHAGKGKPSKLVFVSDDSMLLTTGFSTAGQRQFALWDSVSTAVNVMESFCAVKAKFRYAIWSQTGSKLVADLLARASSLLAT